MATVAARVTALNEDDFPGWATVQILLAGGGTATIDDKVPVLGIDAGCHIGDVIRLDCDVLDRSQGAALVRMRHGVSTQAESDVLLVHESAVADT